MFISLVIFYKAEWLRRKLYKQFSIHSNPPFIKKKLHFTFPWAVFLFPIKIQKNPKTSIHAFLQWVCKYKNSLFISFFSFWVLFSLIYMWSYFINFNGYTKYQISLLLLLFKFSVEDLVITVQLWQVLSDWLIKSKNNSSA